MSSLCRGAPGSAEDDAVAAGKVLFHCDVDEFRLLQLIANQGALAIEQARMHTEEDERHRLERELDVLEEAEWILGIRQRSEHRLRAHADPSVVQR